MKVNLLRFRYIVHILWSLPGPLAVGDTLFHTVVARNLQVLTLLWLCTTFSLTVWFVKNIFVVFLVSQSLYFNFYYPSIFFIF